jgi:hypothetical protein
LRALPALFYTEIGYYCTVKMASVNIDFKKMAVAFRTHVRMKASNAGSTIVYLSNGWLIEENPKDSSKVQKIDFSITK